MKRKTVRSQFSVLMVGAGGISNSWFPVLKKENVNILGVVDLRPEVAQAKLEKYEVQCPIFTSLKEALRKVEPDFVLDLTIPDAHANVTITALHAGYPVLGEKPMTSNLKDALRMVRASKRTGKLFMVSQSRRWDAKHKTIRQAVKNRLIGDVTTLNCDFYIGAHFGGFRTQMDNPLILDMAVHHFDMARFFHQAKPVSVYTHEFNPRKSWYKGNAAATCVFEMDDGSIFTYRGSWCAEGFRTSWNGNWRIGGVKGALLYENDQLPRGEVVKKTKNFLYPTAPLKMPQVPFSNDSMHGALCEMLEFLKTGKRPQTECSDNIWSLAMVLGAIESAKKKKKIPIRLPKL